MDPAMFLLMAFAYNVHCGELPQDVSLKAKELYQAMTPDRRWQVKQWAEYDTYGVGRVLQDQSENYAPSVRAPLIRNHKWLCDRHLQMMRNADKPPPPPPPGSTLGGVWTLEPPHAR
jgi:hypothetical protein